MLRRWVDPRVVLETESEKEEDGSQVMEMGEMLVEEQDAMGKLETAPVT